MTSGLKQNSAFRRAVLAFYKKHGRAHLPWRKTKNPYRILVSEIMLQQTQVGRVILYYEKFLRQFPTIHALAKAPLSGVLIAWQGLGYNRRAKMLHQAARAIISKYGGKFPKEKDALMNLPGIGPYTAGAVRVFAFNEPEVLIETNIRSAYIHHFFAHRRKVGDRELLQLTIVPAKPSPRLWYSALMDYGSHLKSVTVNPSRRSAHHAKQKAFKGSDREIRGAILKILSRHAANEKGLSSLPFQKTRVREQINALVREGLIQRRGNTYALSD